MGKRSGIVLFSLVFSHFIFGQEVYFNKKYNLGNCSGGDGESILAEKGGYMVLGPTYKDAGCSYGGYAV